MAKQLPPSKVLSYTVVGSSGHSASYTPDNITRNLPNDQASRWSSASNDQNQFLLLKLDKMSLIEFISFGKFHKDPSNLSLILHSGLNNDTEPESFPPDWSLTGRELNFNYETGTFMKFPVLYLKIVPIAAWGSNFNFSIWYMELRGWDQQESLVLPQLADFNAFKEKSTTRLVLKFLRDHKHQAAFNVLQASTGVHLEAASITEMHNLFQCGKLVDVENLLIKLYQENPSIFDEYLHETIPYTATWKRIDTQFVTNSPNNTNSISDSRLDQNGDYKMTDDHESSTSASLWKQPAPRGGHQMIWDPIKNRVLLLGGWSGQKDLSDFWAYYPDARGGIDGWNLISMDVERDGGPSARSCHKAVLHLGRREIYVLGRYIEPERRELNSSDSANSNVNNGMIPSDFFKYSIDTDTWSRLSADVRSQGGPACIYDHQMIVDEDSDTIWVFGGRTLGASGDGSSVYSGLYKYDIQSQLWSLVRSDFIGSSGRSTVSAGGSTTTTISPLQIPSRIGHSMLFDPKNRSLLILSGQRFKDHLTDFYRYDLDRDTVTHMQKNVQLVGGPEAGFTQRACLDVENREMFVFTGLLRGGSGNTISSPENGKDTAAAGSGEDSSTSTTTTFWSCDLDTERWTLIKGQASAKSNGQGRGKEKRIYNDDDGQHPMPRFAHQIVYDPAGKRLFLFGGNPGLSSDPSARLNDFWSVQLEKALKPADVLRRCQYLIRRSIFNALLGNNGSDIIPTALHYLQNDLSSVVDHSNLEESESFRSLSTKLFLPLRSASASLMNYDAAVEEESERIKLFTEIIKYLPKSMQPPQRSL